VRAALESIAYQVSDLVKAMERDANVKIARLAVDGGASKNNFLMGFQADILGCETVRPNVVETTALGAAYLAGISCGQWKSVDDVKQNFVADRVFKPTMSEETRLSLLQGWQKAVRQTLQK
jgi:glycerol kinase